jgi:large subunit ribosomal protein L25
VTLPPGVEAVVPKGEDPTVATVVIPRVLTAEEEAAEIAAAAAAPSAAGKTAGVAVTHELNEIQISCLPKDLPEFIEIDLAELKAGDTIHLSEVKLPAGVEVPELKLGADHDGAVVVARHVREEVEEVATEEGVEAPAATPEAGEAAGEGE